MIASLIVLFLPYVRLMPVWLRNSQRRYSNAKPGGRSVRSVQVFALREAVKSVVYALGAGSCAATTCGAAVVGGACWRLAARLPDPGSGYLGRLSIERRPPTTIIGKARSKDYRPMAYSGPVTLRSCVR